MHRKFTAALLALSSLCAAPTTLAESALLQTFRAQLRQAEQLGMTDIAAAIRPMIQTLEEEEASNAGAANAETVANVRPSYFAEVGRANLETCAYAKDVQFDTICAAAMVRYQDYLVAMGSGAGPAVQEEAWRRHVDTARVYLHGIGQAGHAVLPDEGRIVPANSAGTPATANSSAGQAVPERSEPCPKGRSCVTKQ